jgi:transposase
MKPLEIENIEEVFHLEEPWKIDAWYFHQDKKELHVYAEVSRESLFTCTNCGAKSQPMYDIGDNNRTWRHLNFLEYPCYLHAELPRTNCSQCGKIRRVDVPWAIKTRANFTKHFDAWIIQLAKDMPMNAVSRLVGEHDTQLWRILHYYVDHAIKTADLTDVTMISTDETSSKKGHNYVTIFMDSKKKMLSM